MKSRQPITKGKRSLLLFVVLGAISVIAACNFSSSPLPPVRIGFIAPITGSTNPIIGTRMVKVAQLAVEIVNEKGGLSVGDRQQKVVLVVEDNQDNPDEAVAAANRLINQENVVAIVGLSRSRNAIPVANVAEKAQIPTISCNSTNPQTTAGKKYVFRVPFLDTFQGQAIAQIAVEELGANTAAVLYDIASEYNRNLATLFQAEFERLGGQIVAFESYTSDQQDFTSQLERIRDRDASILFLPNYSEDILKQARQIRQLGIQATLLGGDSWSVFQEANLLELEGSFFTTYWTRDLANAQTAEFIKAYFRRYQEIPLSGGVLCYDALGLIFHAIETQGRSDPESIRLGLANTKNYQGVSGTISYSGSGDPIKPIIFLQVKAGKARFYKLVNPLLGCRNLTEDC